MIKIYFNRDIANVCKPTGYEFQFVAHLFNNTDKFNQPRFKPVLEEGSKHIIWASAEEADYHLMPYKWASNNLYNNLVINEAKKYNKPLIISFIDDSQPDINIPNSIILKANIDIDKKKDNEICVPIYPNTNYYLFEPTLNIKSIGFCGQVDKPTLRKDVCELLKNGKWKTEFIYRSQFHWFYQESQLDTMREEYANNLKNNMFSLAVRGVGNFSYRLCEIMHMGRIPIIIKTNNVLPLENFIDWNEIAVICDEKEIHLLNNKIEEFIKTKNVFDIQIKNRNIWEEWLSPLGFTKNLKIILSNG